VIVRFKPPGPVTRANAVVAIANGVEVSTFPFSTGQDES
jgi:hypothetical protein